MSYSVMVSTRDFGSLSIGSSPIKTTTFNDKPINHNV